LANFQFPVHDFTLADWMLLNQISDAMYARAVLLEHGFELQSTPTSQTAGGIHRGARMVWRKQSHS
jgi:hypothetical protein